MQTETYRPTDVLLFFALVTNEGAAYKIIRSGESDQVSDFSQLDSNFHQEHSKRHVGFVSAPVFARPDGMRRGEATFPVP